jgi:protein MpaA
VKKIVDWPSFSATVLLASLASLSQSAIAESTYNQGIETERLSESLDLPEQPTQQETLPGLSKKGSQQAIRELCTRIGNKLGSVSVKTCLDAGLEATGGWSESGTAIGVREYPPMLERKQPKGRVLLLGGIHGDEYSAVSVVFKWMKTLDKYHSGLFHWHVVPAANPDGLLQARSQRMNSNGVDLNRNFPTENWTKEAGRYWAWTGQNKRRYPGKSAASESETQWIIKQIEEFAPDVIVQVHAPYGIVDFDGPDMPPKNLGRLYLNLLGTFPGSLGNYGGTVNNIPVVTIELPSAGSLPSDGDVSRIWTDLVRWLSRSLPRDPTGKNDSSHPQKISQ